jgi:hypothetical protein
MLILSVNKGTADVLRQQHIIRLYLFSLIFFTLKADETEPYSAEVVLDTSSSFIDPFLDTSKVP